MKIKFIQTVLFVLPFILLIKIFLPWFVMPYITGGDWPYYGKGMFEGISILAPFWAGQNGIGLGGVNPDFPLFGYLYLTIGLFVKTLHITWEITYKLFWFGLSISLGLVSVNYLYRSIKRSASLWEVSLSSFLYLCNTYFLMVVGGGQMGVALSYTVAPLVVGSVIGATSVLEEKENFRLLLRKSVILGLFLSVQLFFDPRIAFLTVGVSFLYTIYTYFVQRNQYWRRLLYYWVLAMGTVAVLHSYWVLPFYLFKLLYIPKGITSGSGFAFFSFADFSHAFSFLHPNWPENIFGKVYFLQPEFLLYPLVAFGGLLVVYTKSFTKRKEETALYLFFSFIALVGIFLAKGATEPLGWINVWLFSHIPEFNLFRDPTKFYLFIALSYSLLIPLTANFLYDALQTKKVYQFITVVVLTFLMILPVRDAVLGKLGGTFTYIAIPQEYTKLGDMLSPQKSFFRTLWIPTQSRFRFVSENHTVVVAEDIFHTSSPSAIIAELQKPTIKDHLEHLAIKYLIVPDDTTAEIFLTDRKYDDKMRQNFIQQLDAIAYLKKTVIGKIVLYELPSPREHFYFEDGENVTYQRRSASDFIVTLNNNKQRTLIFADAFHPGWIAKAGNTTIYSSLTKDGLNSFVVPAGTSTLHVVFLPQQYQRYFYLISGLSLIGILLVLLLTRKQASN